MEVLDKDIKLVTLVERFPQLYDKSNVNYKDRTAVENAWLFMSRELQIPSKYIHKYYKYYNDKL